MFKRCLLNNRLLIATDNNVYYDKKTATVIKAGPSLSALFQYSDTDTEGLHSILEDMEGNRTLVSDDGLEALRSNIDTELLDKLEGYIFLSPMEKATMFRVLKTEVKTVKFQQATGISEQVPSAHYYMEEIYTGSLVAIEDFPFHEFLVAFCSLSVSTLRDLLQRASVKDYTGVLDKLTAEYVLPFQQFVTINKPGNNEDAGIQPIQKLFTKTYGDVIWQETAFTAAQLQRVLIEDAENGYANNGIVGPKLRAYLRGKL